MGFFLTVWIDKIRIVSSEQTVMVTNHGLPILYVVSFPDELIVGRFFSCYEVI